MKLTSRIFKSSYLKRRVPGTQESKNFKLGHCLGTALVNNLIIDSRDDIMLHKIHRVLEDGIAQKRIVDHKLSSIKNSIDFVARASDENESKKYAD